ncbi:MAG: hypothetical protein LBK63_09235 [Treponema sp.]|jgi:hypothetical protein|nr:hypothetical protein [Treponema sp.]
MEQESTPFAVSMEEYEEFKKREFKYRNQRIDDSDKSVFSLMAEDLEIFSKSAIGKTVLDTLSKEDF